MSNPEASKSADPGGSARTVPWMLLLRMVLLVDGIVLGALGVALILSPAQIQTVFGFGDLPSDVRYLLGMWGCGLISLGLGYLVAASNPIRHLIWVQVGILRGVLETGLGLYFVARGAVEWKQAGFGVALAALVTLAYLILYPRPRRDIRPIGTEA